MSTCQLSGHYRQASKRAWVDDFASRLRGERAAGIYSLLGTAQLNGLNIEAYLRHLLERLPEHPINRVDELLPWAIANELPALKLAA